MQDEECVVSDEEEAQVTKYNRKKTKAKVGDSDSENDIYVNVLPKTKAKDSVPTTSTKANSKDLRTTTSSKAKSKDSEPTTSSKAKSKDILLSKSTNHVKPKTGPTDSLRRSTRARN